MAETLTREGWIDLSGLVFRYWEAGPPTAMPIVLLHALGRSADDWLTVSAALADRWRVIALDQRGHGRSGRPGTYSFELMRDDLAALADALGFERFGLVGHSMGGTVAYLYAEAHPERVWRLILEDTPPPYPSNWPEPTEIPDDLPFDGHLLRPIVRQLNAPDPAWWDRLRDITAPVLVVGGGATSHIPQDKLEDVVARVPDGRLVTIEGAGHRVHETHPAAFVAAVREFLTSTAHE